MNILIISFPASALRIGGEDQISSVLKSNLEKLGCKVDICSRENSDILSKKEYDLVLSLSLPVEILDKKSAIWIAWVFNENLGDNFESIMSYNYDIYISNSKSFVEYCKDKEIPCLYYSFPAFSYYKRNNELKDLKDIETDVLYLGNYHPEYKGIDEIHRYLLPCTEYNFNIFGGRDWKLESQKFLCKQNKIKPEHLCSLYEPYYKGLLPLENISNVSDYSKIFINFNSISQKNLGMINNRIFDFLANGCFVITDETKEQKELFGDCVEYTSGNKHLKDLIDHYINNLDEIDCFRTKALEFSKEYNTKFSYKKLSIEILNIFNSFKSKIIKQRNKYDFYYYILVDDVDLLDNCISSIVKNKSNITRHIKIFSLKKNRIRTCFVLKKHSLPDDSLVIVDDIYNFDINDITVNDGELIIPTFSSFVYPIYFEEKVLEHLKRNNTSKIIRFNGIDTNNLHFKYQSILNGHLVNKFDKNCILPYGLIALTSKKAFRISYLEDVSVDAVFLSKNIRNKYIQKKKKNKEEKEESKELQENKKKEETKIRDANISNLRFSVLNNDDINIEYSNIEKISINKDLEGKVRKLQSHYTIVGKIKDYFDWKKIAKIISCYFNYELIFFDSVVFIKTSELYVFPPFNNIKDLINYCIKNYKSYNSLKVNKITYDITKLNNNKIKIKDNKGLKIAIVSMCGVSSYEDKYGIGGEHQVIHWLKKSAEKRSDVFLCHIFDTYNCDLMNPDDYDIIFSNSCWRTFEHRRTRKDNITIFWHFNMDSGKATLETIERMNYDWIWTNSYIANDYFKNKEKKCIFKNLNASSQYHYPYEYSSSLYKHDVCYLGGYQVHYKGLDLIHRFIDPCLNQDFDFAIYGNRLWKASEQLKAMKIDSYFKKEYYNDQYEKYYHGILPMQDFSILARNTKIWVNFNASTQRKMQMNNDRPIWALACNAFVITDDLPEAHKFYEQYGKENCPIEFSSGGDDLLDKIHYYLEHKTERLKIAQRGNSFIKKNSLYTDDTVNLMIDLYYKEKNNV